MHDSLNREGMSARRALPRVLWSRAGFTALGLKAIAASWLLANSPFWLLPGTLFAVYLACGIAWRANQIAAAHLATIEALALAIDAKDQTAPYHIRRVQVYASGLSRELGMSPHDIQGVKIAALLHDIGKLAVPDHILAKPGALTPEEFQKVRIHPRVGAAIIGHVPFPYVVAPFILNHHERWDGRGYPAGLRETQIPLGARILSIVDYFDALTSERPYHHAMPVDAAVALLEQEAGKALDPEAVTTFVRILPGLRAEIRRAGMDAAAAPAAAPVFEDIALAHREIYALYQIAQTMGTSLGIADTMAVISSKLTRLVPFSTCALFLHTETTETLHCRFAVGVEAELLKGASVRNGEGL